MQNMKKILRGLCAALFCFCLMSCIDIVQHITRNSDGSDQNIICLAVSKDLCESASGYTGYGDSFNYEEFLAQEFDSLASAMAEYHPIDVQVSPISDEVHLGYFVNMNINYKDQRVQKLLKSGELDFLPVYKKNMMSIRIGSMSDSDFTDPMLLSLCRYRLLVSKSCMPSLRTVAVRNNIEMTPVSFFDLHDEYLIEVPFSLLMGENTAVELYR